MNRREMKKRAKKVLRGHYWILVIVCLFAGFIGAEYGGSFIQMSYQEDTEQVSSNLKAMVTDIAEDNEEEARQSVATKREEIKENDTSKTLGRSRGVLSSVLNSFSSGGVILSLTDGIRSLVHSENAVLVLLILISLAIYLFVWLFIKETYLIVLRRIVLESRIYEKVPLRRFLYPIQTNQWPRMAWTMFVRFIFQSLWNLTIIGGIIKYYSYFMVPYIMAENPKIKALDAITLSRRMMKGHKWECFTAELSFLGWNILNLVTVGISGIFFSNPYEAAFYGEYYVYLRECAKDQQIQGVQDLCDDYLYKLPQHSTLYAAYDDVIAVVNELPQKIEPPRGIVGILSEWFGILPFFSKEVQEYEEVKALENQIQRGKEILEQKVYPGRLAPTPMKFKMNITSNLTATRSYTVLNLILMFFAISFVGWLWEVGLHLISDGVFVNRGVLHGPWLPIYGTGGILILVVLKKFREKPFLEFISAVVLCGCVEYTVAWQLEMTHNGKKWWDYSGYFLNLHGRICAEGLLVFGLGGLAIVYLVAPALDNQLKRANKKILAVIAGILLVCYIGDQTYSSKHPNEGKGITDYETVTEWRMETGQEFSDSVMGKQQEEQQNDSRSFFICDESA